MNERVPIVQLDTGVPGLNEVLGGGLPEFSFNLLAGGPGAGKTTLVQQISFALATPERPARYITVLGEPPLKLLRYQQQFDFFDPSKINSSLRFLSIPHDVLAAGLGKVLDKIVTEVEAANPSLVVVDSFRSVIRASKQGEAELSLQAFVQRLALHLTSWQATTFLVGEYLDSEQEDNPIFTVADGVLWLSQSKERNAIVRKLQVVKMRGQASVPGLHTLRITEKGITVFPRLPIPLDISADEQRRIEMLPAKIDRLSTGVRGLDDMMNGGIPMGSSMLIAGPSGSGKTILSMQFLAEGLSRREPGLLAVFEKRPSDYLKANSLGRSLARHIQDGLLHVLYLRPLDLSLDETLEEVRTLVNEHGVKRVVIDSLSGLELALAPHFREDFRETLHRMVAMLTAMGITLLLTVELADSYVDLRFSPHGTAFLTDGILLHRYIELDGKIQRMLSVIKLRGSQHSKELRLYEVTNEGLVIGNGLTGYEGLMSGAPRRIRKPE
ncbi:ATPase domain-containing protein [Candidatus Nitrospira nitrificans]|uniref:non-specific serine/threonine protein kinase n=1 Tax=Candidatus Nitrospira nitrificans TaxID=1742973 RepID=A0A0S4LQB0_9BACT|nr:ATPase domain-containing protein [Candidatus Nitrospira nitrificans]CUS39749.1 Circadian clock protein KaiC [Candidatus Nitrospira nitrificans]